MPTSSTTDVERVVGLALEFVEEVREEYAIGMQELLTVQRLLVELAARSALPENPIELEGYLRPILTSNPREHRGFSQRYRGFLQRALPSAVPIGPAEPGSVQSGLVDLRLRKFLLGAALTTLVIVGAIWVGRQLYAEQKDDARVVAAAGAGGSAAGHSPGGDSSVGEGGSGDSAVAGAGAMAGTAHAPGGSPPVNAAGATAIPESPTDAARPPELRGAQWGVLLVVLAAAAWALLWGWLKRRADAIVGSAAGAQQIDAESLLLALPPVRLVPAPVVRQTSALMRARQVARTFELDVFGTVRATAYQAGFFTEVKRALTSVPEYLFLLERRHPHDLDCARQDDLLDQLEQSGVKLVRFYFTSDASLVHPRDPLQRPRALREVEAAHHAHRLVVVAERDSLIDPLTAELASWAAELAAWTKPILFTSSNLDPLLPATQKLRAAGFRLVEASPVGLSTVFGNKNSPTPEQAGQGLVLPSLLGGDERRWLGPVPPEPDVVERCLEQLRLYLGQDGYRWLSACALYPQLRWSLVVALARALDIGPLSESDMVRRLTSLPWMRAARIPAWLRRRLLDDLPPAEKERVQRAVEKIFVGAALPGDPSTLQLRDPGQVRLLYHELSRRWDESPALPSPNDDALYLGMTGDALALRLPRALGRLRAAVKRRVDSASHRDLVQASYGALGVGYVLQLVATALPGNRPVLTTLALLVGCGWALLGVCPPPWQRASARLGVRSLVVLASLIGAALRYVDFEYGDPLGLDNILMCVESFVVLGLPIALFQRGWARAFGVVALLLASAIYKIDSEIFWDIRLPWPGLDYSGSHLSYGEAVARAMRLAPVAVAFALAAVLVESVRASAFRSWWLNAQALANRFAPDRLLFDVGEAEPLPAGPVATALGAAAFGFVVGAASSFPWSKSVVWLQGMYAVVAGLFVAFPHLAAARYQQQERERSWAAARAAYEYALVVGVALYVKIPDTNAWLTTAIPVVGMISLLAAVMFRLPASRGLRNLLERAAPDRLIATSPLFLGLAYCNVLVLLAVGFMHPSIQHPQNAEGAGTMSGNEARIAAAEAELKRLKDEFETAQKREEELRSSLASAKDEATRARSSGARPEQGQGTLIIDPRPTLAFSPPVRMPTKFNLQHGDEPPVLVEARKPVELEPGRYELTFPYDAELLGGQRFIVTIKAGETYSTPFMIRPLDGQLAIVSGPAGAAVTLLGPKGARSGVTYQGYRVPPGKTTITLSGFQDKTVTIESGLAYRVELTPQAEGTSGKAADKPASKK